MGPVDARAARPAKEGGGGATKGGGAKLVAMPIFGEDKAAVYRIRLGHGLREWRETEYNQEMGNATAGGAAA